MIVVGNQKPAFPLPERTRFVEVDFPPPTEFAGRMNDLAQHLWDKGTKLGIGLIAARSLDPDYVMFFDADDFVHRGLAAFVHERPGRPGWYVRRGLIYSRARNAYAPRLRLFRICGSTYVIPFSAHKVPADLLATASQDQVVEAFGPERIERVVAGHRWAREWWRDHGVELEPLPFPGAVYHVDTGENHSRSVLAGPALPYRSHLLTDFGIRPSKTPARTYWSAFGLPAFKPDLRVRPPAFLRPKAPRMVRPPSSVA
ncbi:glycosyltransferase family 2 protein [Mycolicibacterium sp. P9-22]|uniref:glycosyltransferase family 2 protein n=1 Tax=Mycolicibacterium sp. P9-22 TaxID=2024613 RepID=UPI001D13CFF8|nr:glycosyltransferase family 2 protein [Mycolicibacterium sp. P9-22]